MATWTFVWYAGTGSVETPEGDRESLPLHGEMISALPVTVGSSTGDDASPITPPEGAAYVEIIADASDGDGYLWIAPETAALAADKYKPIRSGYTHTHGVKGKQIAHGTSIPS